MSQGFSRTQAARHHRYFTLTIAASATDSGSACIAGYENFALFVPTITGSILTFKGNFYDGGTFYTITKDGTAVLMNGLAATGSALYTGASAFTYFAGLYGLKIAASTAQAGSVSFLLGCKS